LVTNKHVDFVAKSAETAQLAALIKKNDLLLSAKDQQRHKIESMKTTLMKSFFRVIPKQTNSSEHSSAVVKQNSLPVDYTTHFQQLS
jgi:hypothetical protein